MQIRVVRVTPLPWYRLQVECDDGVTGIVDLAGELTGLVFGPLRDEPAILEDDDWLTFRPRGLSKKARYAPWRSCAFISARKVALMRVW